MRQRIKIFNLLLITILAATLGCDSNTKKIEAKKGPDHFLFVESSNGLPSTNQWRQNIAFYDVNGDGHMDILAPPPRKAPKGDGKPVVWHGNGKGEWSESQLDVPSDFPGGYGGITVSDFNNDGIADIALAIHGLGVKVLKGEGGARYVDFSDGLPSHKEFSSRALMSSDLDNDGIDDIVALSEGTSGDEVLSQYGIWAFSRSNGTWRIHPIGGEKLRLLLTGDQLVAGDVNGDGNKDIAVTTSEHTKDLIVWIGDGKGGFTPFNKGLPQGKHYGSVDLVDLDKDGRDDLVASITGFGKDGWMVLKAFLSSPDGFKDVSDGLPTKEVFHSVRACDLDGDGSVEIIGGSAEGGIKIFSQKGNRWHEASVSGLPKKGLLRIYNVYCVDLNKDGYKDIAVNYALDRNNSGGIRVFFNVPNKTSPSGK